MTRLIRIETSVIARSDNDAAISILGLYNIIKLKSDLAKTNRGSIEDSGRDIEQI